MTRHVWMPGVAVVVTVGMLAGCNSHTGSPPLPTRDPPIQTELSEKVSIDVYLDSSMPMRGFLAPAVELDPVTGQRRPQRNYFAELLDKGDSVLRAGWDADLHYWRFGSKAPTSIGSMRRYFVDPELFADQSSDIDMAVTHAGSKTEDRARVRLVITDLLMTGDSVGAVATALNRDLENDGQAVGVLAVRNPFDGDVDDLLGAPGFDGIRRGGVDSLPFYVLARGRIADVRHVLARLEKVMDVDAALLEGQAADEEPQEKQAFKVVYTRLLASQVDQPLAVRPADPAETSTGFASAQFVTGAAERSIPQLKLVEDRRVTLRLEVPGRGEGIPGAELLKGIRERCVCPFEVASAPDLHVSEWRPNEPNGMSPTTDETVTRAVILELKNSTLVVDAGRLEAGVFYQVRIEVVAKRPAKGFDFAPWSLDDPRRVIAAGAFEKVGDRQPGKTPNLEFFIDRLSDGMFAKRIPLARYDLFVKEN